jgi:lipopolysaccharide heptosyltransferase II
LFAAQEQDCIAQRGGGVKLLIRATNWVGDAIMALPALRAVRKRFPEAEIAILALPYVADIYRGQGITDELIGYDRKGEHAGFRGRERLIAELRSKKFNTALLLQNAFDAAWIAWRAGISERIGYNRDGRGLLLTKAIRTPRAGEIPVHEKFYYLELVKRAGWIDTIPDIQEISLLVTEEQSRRAEEKLQSFGSKHGAVRIAFGAGAAYGSAKCWPPERFAAAINQLLKRRGAEVILFGTSSEIAVSAAIQAGLEQAALDLTGKTEIAELPALLSRCTAFVGNDSGAMHVAAAVGLPVIAVFGPTDPHGTAPVTPRCTIVQEKSYCSPCFLRRCPTDHRCMTVIAPERVSTGVLQALAEVATG